MSAAQNVWQHPVVVQAQNKVHYHLSQLDKELAKYPVLHTIEQRTQVPKTFLAIGTVVLLALFHFINPLAAPISNFIGWALPAYLSIKSLERPVPQDDVQWLTYWVIFGFLNLTENVALGLILYYVPWYFALKTIFVLWLQLPNFRGAQIVYANAFKLVLAQVAGPYRTVVSTDTVTAEGLRGHVQAATSD